MSTNKRSTSSPLRFVLLVFALSIPFWLVDAGGEKLNQVIPINLPLSALMFVCPLIAASILTFKTSGADGVKKLLRRALEYNRTRQRIWYIPALFLMPAVMTLSYIILTLIGELIPKPQVSIQLILIAVILFLVFFLAAFGEEVGWSGYAIDPMQNRSSALNSALILGSVWAVWHVVPYVESGDSLQWIAWQCLFTIGARVVIVWLYNNAGKSVLAAILFHTMVNVSSFLFPVYGSFYNPEVTGLLTMILAAIVTILWGPNSLSRYRFSKQTGQMTRIGQ